ncbi:MAG TPA: class I SAM-dependent methyltransferase [Accumulibacter sp.]|nr:class I SAM-dependent methyltransferase [Accumulibacter sp.]HMW18129.1 class I SAM-dependent methyltransferase [Accumulibacter sp.]HMX22759.1 class I SAM-dependent methyltransferase [Accumulibacter sp.]HNC16879.1 class I SAM-dependent methyltransferase [Accumulibacter sp.]HND79515.1 class I SAM-dependent methyltransferase [Accumulibacter sp.]
MNESLLTLLRDIEQFGVNNDRLITDRPRRMLNITHDTGEFLAVLVRSTNARRILEIGTSNGYSTLWLAWAATATAGHVTTVEFSEAKIALAAKNFQHSGLAAAITQHHGDAGEVLRNAADAGFDFIFLDSDRDEYLNWWPDLRRVIRPDGLLVVDNALSHSAEMAPFIKQVREDAEFTVCTVAVGNGEFLATRGLASQ